MMTREEATAIYDNAAANMPPRLNSRRSLAIKRLIEGKAAWLCLDDYSNHWAVNTVCHAMGEDMGYGWGTFPSLPAFVLWEHQEKRIVGNTLLKRLTRIKPLNGAAEAELDEVINLIKEGKIS